MRINNQQLIGIQKAYGQQKQITQQKDNKYCPKNDGVELSSEGRFYGTAMQALRNMPERTDLAHIKEQVKAGTYNISNEEIADKLWQEKILDELI